MLISDVSYCILVVVFYTAHMLLIAMIKMVSSVYGWNSQNTRRKILAMVKGST